MKQILNILFDAVLIWVLVSLALAGIRFKAHDCKKREMDLFFPLSKIHCEVVK
jgi:hypothetical protein